MSWNLLYKSSSSEIKNEAVPLCFRNAKIVDMMSDNGLDLKVPDKIKYFRKPSPTSYPLDLNKNFHSYQFRTGSYLTTSMDKIEHFLLNEAEAGKFLQSENAEKIKICAQRRFLCDMMLMPYYPHGDESFFFVATKWNGVIYIATKTSEEEKQIRHSYHFKQQQYCFVDSPNEKPDMNASYNENDRNYCVYRAQLENFDLLFSAEISGILSEIEIKDLTDMKVLNKCRFVHTKLLKENDMRYPLKKNRKVSAWWAQSRLVNVRDIFLGYNSRDGFVRNPLRHVFVEDLKKGKLFEEEVCFYSLHKFLTNLASKMDGVNCPYTVYEIEVKPITICINYRIHDGKNVNSFLSENFIQTMKI